jgi:hypothetical protein
MPTDQPQYIVNYVQIEVCKAFAHHTHTRKFLSALLAYRKLNVKVDAQDLAIWQTNFFRSGFNKYINRRHGTVKKQSEGWNDPISQANHPIASCTWRAVKYPKRQHSHNRENNFITNSINLVVN